MKNCVLKISLLCFLNIFIICRSYGQTVSNDTGNVSSAISGITREFYNSVGQASRLYNGHEYLPYDRQVKGTALFPYDVHSWETGEVTYDGVLYRNVPMMYDIYKGELVILLYNKFSMCALLNNRVRDFSFANHHFVRLDADSIPNNTAGVVTGFYDQLYGGKTQVVARRSKTIQNSSNAVAVPEIYFISKDEYYIRKGGAYYKVNNSQHAVLSLLKDKKSALQKYLKDNDIRYNDNPDENMAKLAAYYDSLAN